MDSSEPQAIDLRLSPEAERYLVEVEQRRLAVLSAVSRLPIGVLIWGPAPTGDSRVAQARRLLRDEMIRRGHLAQFSEDLLLKDSTYSVQLQQLSHVEAADIVFSLPDSPGSIAEVHDFAKLPKLSHKIVTFLDRQWNDGYANRSLIELQSRVTCAIEPYDAEQLPSCIISKAAEMVGRLQELYWLLGRRL